ncbi:hypothetical protein NDU88_006042 [Pleurodeles waltl]|uniref:Uncharacterized protein n=1 Tax=Pleurodeles waltl TaxID=8319 RepID=A0AAV7MER1_PLEWA|nr:hypothetical protein NDU88_006042 [Pleurodeles waltl]
MKQHGTRIAIMQDTGLNILSHIMTLFNIGDTFSYVTFYLWPDIVMAKHSEQHIEWGYNKGGQWGKLEGASHTTQQQLFAQLFAQLVTYYRWRARYDFKFLKPLLTIRPVQGIVKPSKKSVAISLPSLVWG